MTNRAELIRLVEGLSEAEVMTALRFVQFLEAGHIRPQVAGFRVPRRQIKAILDAVELVASPGTEATPPLRPREPSRG